MFGFAIPERKATSGTSISASVWSLGFVFSDALVLRCVPCGGCAFHFVVVIDGRRNTFLLYLRV